MELQCELLAMLIIKPLVSHTVNTLLTFPLSRYYHLSASICKMALSLSKPLHRIRITTTDNVLHDVFDC